MMAAFAMANPVCFTIIVVVGMVAAVVLFFLFTR